MLYHLPPLQDGLRSLSVRVASIDTTLSGRCHIGCSKYGITTDEILNAADWNTESSFQWVLLQAYPQHFLFLAFSYTLICETESSEIKYRMAKTDHKVAEYMKVKSSISMVPPTLTLACKLICSPITR